MNEKTIGHLLQLAAISYLWLVVEPLTIVIFGGLWAISLILVEPKEEKI